MIYENDVVRVKVSKDIFNTSIDTSCPYRVVRLFDDGDVGVERTDDEYRFVVSSTDIEPWSVRNTIFARMNMITQLQREVANLQHQLDDLQSQLDEDGDKS